MKDRELEKPGLARVEDQRLQADLDRALTDKLLAQRDVGAAVVRDFEANASLQLPTLADIDRVLGPQEAAAQQSQRDLESLLSLDTMGDIAVEGIRLNELLSHGVDSLQQRAILKTGLLFLRRKRYSEAAEWWLLNRPKDPLADARFYCVATLLLAFTHQLSGQKALAEAAVQDAVRAKKLL